MLQLAGWASAAALRKRVKDPAARAVVQAVVQAAARAAGRVEARVAARIAAKAWLAAPDRVLLPLMWVVQVAL